jgi:hypothetical protein
MCCSVEAEHFLKMSLEASVFCTVRVLGQQKFHCSKAVSEAPIYMYNIDLVVFITSFLNALLSMLV